MKVKPMGMLLMMLAGWVNRHQQDVIAYLKEENKVLREKLGTRRILLRVRAFPRARHQRVLTMICGWGQPLS